MDPIDDTFGMILLSLLILKVVLLKKDNRKEFITRYIVLCVCLELGKNFIGKLRPDKSDYRSFPSGHSGNAWFLAASYDFNIFTLFWAIAVGISRIMLRRHDLFDVIGGAILGITIAKLNINDMIALFQNINYYNKL